MRFSTWDDCSCGGEIDWQAVLNGKPQSQDLDEYVCQMALPGYIEALKQADWFYEFADDPRAYGAGAKQINSLKETAKMSLGHQIAFNRAYCAAFPSASPPWPFPGAPNEFPTLTTVSDGITKSNETKTDKNKRMKSAIAIILVFLVAIVEAAKSIIPELKSLAASGGDDDTPPKKKAAADDDDTPPKKKKVADDDDTPPKKKKVADDDDDTPPKKKKAAADDDDTPPKKKKLVEEDEEEEITFKTVKAAVQPLVEADEALAEKGKKEIHVQSVFDLLAKKPYEVEKISDLKPAQYPRFMKDIKALVEEL